MSHVDNVLLSFSIIEDSTDHAEGPDTWPIMEAVNEWLATNAGGQQFGPDLGGFLEGVYGGSKFLETPLFLAAFNYLPEDEFLAFLRALPWKEPSEVQFIVKRQHDDLFEIVRPCVDG